MTIRLAARETMSLLCFERINRNMRLNSLAVLGVFITCLSISPVFGKAKPGVIWATWNADGFDNPQGVVQKITQAGFSRVCIVPTWFMIDLDKVGWKRTASFSRQKELIKELLRQGQEIIYRPHLDPVKYSAGYEQQLTDDHGWVAGIPWRGMFDIDPMASWYREQIVEASIKMLAEAIAETGVLPAGGAIRLDLGAELMNSTIFRSERWLEMVKDLKGSQIYQQNKGWLRLGHNFSHHIQIDADFLERMNAASRKALGLYIQELDTVTVSQYMDLTIKDMDGMVEPTEVAAALAIHLKVFQKVLSVGLGVPQGSMPAIELGEYGIGWGGLRHPNLWDGDPDKRAAGDEVLVGLQGLINWMEQNPEQKALLWISGPYYDLFRWGGFQFPERTEAGLWLSRYLRD